MKSEPSATPADVEKWTEGTEGRLSDVRRQKRRAKLSKFAGVDAYMPLRMERPAVAEGQIWSLVESAGLPNLLVYVTCESRADEAAGLIHVHGVSHRIQFATPKDITIRESFSPFGFDFMIESWNTLDLSPRLLAHCMGSVPADYARLTREIAAGRLSADAQPLRWPGDPRIDFQREELRRYSLARRLTRHNTDKLISAVVTDFPVNRLSKSAAVHESSNVLRMAAKAGATITALLNVYKPVLTHPALRVALVVWADGTVGIAAESPDPAFSAEFTTHDDMLLPVESCYSDKNIRIWKVVDVKAPLQEGFDGIFHVNAGLTTVTLQPGISASQDPRINTFADHAASFEAGGARLPDLLHLVSACEDRILQVLLEDDVKRVIRLDKSHPSWPKVHALLKEYGTSKLRRWADEQNR